MRDSEEHHEWGPVKSWLFIIGLSASLFIFMELLMMIPEVPREWDHGTLPFTPSESVYSTAVVEDSAQNRMVEPLPELNQETDEDSGSQKETIPSTRP